jgi:hypothetical protein
MVVDGGLAISGLVVTTFRLAHRQRQKENRLEGFPSLNDHTKYTWYPNSGGGGDGESITFGIELFHPFTHSSINLSFLHSFFHLIQL